MWLDRTVGLLSWARCGETAALWNTVAGHWTDPGTASLRVKLPNGGLPCPNFVAQSGEAAAGGDEAEYDFVGQRHDKAVAPAPEVSAGPPVLRRELRNEGQSAVLDCAPLLGREPHWAEAARRAQRERLPTAQQNRQALLFQRGVQAANHAATASLQAAAWSNALRIVAPGVSFEHRKAVRVSPDDR